MSNDRKVAIVTGASQGIGQAIAEAYMRRGYRVVATSRSIAPSATSDRLAIAGDIGLPETGRRIVDEALGHFGRVDTLVNNAGIFVAKPFTSYTDDDYAQVLATNVAGFFFVTRAAVEAMEKGGGGHVVSITTTLVDHALAAVPSVLASLSKGGIDAATRSLATEYAKRNIRVNAVAPGIVDTPMHPADTHAALSALHPMGRLGDVDEIVQAVLYLEGASFVTGETIHVDGGQIAGH